MVTTTIFRIDDTSVIMKESFDLDIRLNEHIQLSSFNWYILTVLGDKDLIFHKADFKVVDIYYDYHSDSDSESKVLKRVYLER